MSPVVARKIEFDELFNSTTMFYVNEEFEQAMEQEVKNKVDELFNDLQSIDTKEGLKKYIVEHKDSLDNLTSLMEISTERFKRMVSMIRKERGFVFATEWGLGKIRTAMMESPAMMESVINLIWAGRDDVQFLSCFLDAVVEVVNIEYFGEEKIPLPIEKTKKIIRKCKDEDFELHTE